MHVGHIHRFYQTPAGQFAQHIFRARLPALKEPCLWLGYAQDMRQPHDLWGLNAQSLALDLSAHSHVFFFQSDFLPFQPNSFRHVRVLHGLEFSRDADLFLDNIWDILEGEGDVDIFVPNRSGLWARGDETPFGEGRPFTRRQITALLQKSGFSILSSDTLLFCPLFLLGSDKPWVVKLACGIEWLGQRIARPFGGVIHLRCRKDVFRPKMIKETQKVFAVQVMPA